jgi:redox-sensitive bicupin YhaK (pirin superfamily)
VLEDALEHRDSMGNGSVIRPGDVQRMSAGTGVRHSEYNPSSEDPVHFLQIWLEPDTTGVPPGYEQRHYSAERRRGRLVLLVSPDGRDGSIAINQDALLYGILLIAGERLSYQPGDGRRAYVHIARGSARVNDEALDGGDGVAMENLGEVRLEGISETEVLLFDLP